MKKIVISFFVLLFFSGFANENFESGMGKGTRAWKYVQTPEDFQRIEFFGNLFENFEKKLHPKEGIPKTLHFIWLGPDAFPKQSKERIKKWIALHPKWTAKFWTDVDRDPPHKKMQKVLVHGPALLRDEFFHSINFGEKSKLLAYEILFQEGGVYVDHDSYPSQSLNALNESTDFYCGLEKLGPSIFSSSVRGATYLMAARPAHPILGETISWLKENWDLLEQNYQNQPTMRVLYRTFRALDEGIKRGIDQENNRDVVLPTNYLNSFAKHEHDGTWHRMGSQLESKMHKHLHKSMRNDGNAVLMTILLAILSLIGCFVLWLFAKKAVK